jgi:H+/Cl- antiporter ClcA
VAVTLLTRVGERARRVLATAGSFSAISALFGGPIVGGMMMVEGGLGMGAALLPVLLPGFVAAAVGYVVFVGFGDWGGLGTQSLAVGNLPAYDGTHLLDLLVAVVVGVLAALVIVAVRRLAYRVAGEGGRRLGLPALLLGGGLAVGLLAQLAAWAGDDSQDILFSGQAAVPALVGEDTTKLVLVVLALKAVAYAVSLGCGFRGGPVFPAIFLGIAIATLPVVWWDVSPTLAVAAGAAAGMAAGTKLLITPTLFAALLTGSAGLDAVPAAVLAAAAAWLTVTQLDRRARASGAAVEA